MTELFFDEGVLTQPKVEVGNPTLLSNMERVSYIQTAACLNTKPETHGAELSVARWGIHSLVEHRGLNACYIGSGST